MVMGVAFLFEHQCKSVSGFLVGSKFLCSMCGESVYFLVNLWPLCHSEFHFFCVKLTDTGALHVKSPWGTLRG